MSELREFTSVNQVYELVGNTTVAKWEQMGTLDSKIHWQYGAEADALIQEGVPAMLVYSAIGKKVGKNSQTIRKARYTYISFTAEQREKFHLAPYSIFAHARTNKYPDKVLQHYVDNISSVDEIEAVFPIIENEELEAEITAKGYPRIFYGIVREAFGLGSFLKARVDELLKEIKLILDEANRS